MSKSLKDIVPPHLQQKALDSIPALSHFIVKKGKEYFYSAEGKRHLEDMLDDFFKERGKLINLIQLFIGNEKLIDKIQPEIIKFFEQSRTIDILSVMLVKEWGNLEKWDIEKIGGMIGRETIKQWITEKTSEMLPVASIMNKPVRELTADFSDIIVERRSDFSGKSCRVRNQSFPAAITAFGRYRGRTGFVLFGVLSRGNGRFHH